MVKLFVAIAVLVSAFFTPPVQSANAEQFTFRVQSDYPHIVNIAFYSQSRKRFAWPGWDRHWSIKDYDVHRYNLTCQYGEKICYGAWVKGKQTTYWGVGIYSEEGCRGCCYTCNGGNSKLIVLQ